MIYDFTKEITFDVCLDIDVRNMRIYIEKKYSNCENEEELIVQLKKVIKNDLEFKLLVDELNLTIKELINILAFAYPELFNHYLIKYVRKNYLFKRKTKFAQL